MFNCSRKIEAQVLDYAHGVVDERCGDEEYCDHNRPEDKLNYSGDGRKEHKEGERTDDNELGYKRADYGIAVNLIYVAVFLSLDGSAVGDEIEEAERKLYTEELVKGRHEPGGRFYNKLADALDADGGYTGE